MEEIVVKMEPDDSFAEQETSGIAMKQEIKEMDDNDKSTNDKYRFFVLGLSGVAKQPKSASQRNKEYRARKKLRQADATANSQRCKEYRERKKLGLAGDLYAKTNSQRCKEYRKRKKSGR